MNVVNGISWFVLGYELNDFLAFNTPLFKDRANEMKFENLLHVF